MITDKQREYKKKWLKEKRKNPLYRAKEQKRNRENDNMKKLHQESRIIRRFIVSGGFCWICGELNPRVFAYHHLFGKKKLKNLKMGDLFISLCANCHRKYHSINQITHCAWILKKIEETI